MLSSRRHKPPCGVNLSGMTVYPGTAPEPSPGPQGRDYSPPLDPSRQMPATWRPTPPTAEQRAMTARRQVQRLQIEIAKREAAGDRDGVFALTDDLSKQIRRAKQYEALVEWRLEEPGRETAPLPRRHQ